MAFRKAALIAGLLLPLLPGCSDPAVVSDELIQEIREELPGMTDDCIKKIRLGGIEAMPSGVEFCFKMEPVKRWKGLWRNELEGSIFCSAPARKCSHTHAGDNTWLSFKKDTRPLEDLSNGQLYTIEFMGRRTAVRGAYGHLGTSQHEIVVDVLEAIKKVEEP